MSGWKDIDEKDAKLIIAELYTQGRKELLLSNSNSISKHRHEILSKAYESAARALEELRSTNVVE